MSNHEDYDESAMDDGGQPNPGAPTPLSALEVSFEEDITHHGVGRLTASFT